MNTLKKFINKGSIHKKSKSNDQSPIIEKSGRSYKNELNSIENLEEVFYDAIEDEGMATPVQKKSVIYPSSSIKPEKLELDEVFLYKQ